jgi:hypothetical protein
MKEQERAHNGACIFVLHQHASLVNHTMCDSHALVLAIDVLDLNCSPVALYVDLF